MFEDKLQDFYLNSVVDSESEFTLSPAKQEERLRNFQFENPKVFILLFLAFASQCGATKFSLDIGKRSLSIFFDAAPDIEACVLGDLPYQVVPRSFKERYLTDAVVAAIQHDGFKTLSITSQWNTRQCEVSFSKSSGRTRVSEADLDTELGFASTKIVITYSLFSGAKGDEIRHVLEQWGCLAKLSITINKREMPKSLSRRIRAITNLGTYWESAEPFPLGVKEWEQSPKVLEFSIPGCKEGRLHLLDSSSVKELNIVVDDVLYGFGRTLEEGTSHIDTFLENFPFLVELPSFRLIIYAAGIPTDISRTRLRDSSQLFSAMEKVEKTLIDELCSRVSSANDYKAQKYLLDLASQDRYWSEPKYEGWAKKMTEAMLPFAGWPIALTGLEKEIWTRYWFRYLKPSLDEQNDMEVLPKLEKWGLFHYFDGEDKPSRFLKFDRSPLLELKPFLPRLLKKHFIKK